ncbi:uncharacterized protein EV420DRAFT_142561 [Desarmillaria tabescens]|uniref:Uncharacterized protein n=1 Tax=Armillaria tabescens TaxID=1929756 RepID=A0AA39NAH4_ARMTA|nr:uncharacterized protein EV420DRAFT_142561 [Desarmillaria tabescens]KAK0462036.1 hypothetical protein EV420DRAFT_142561 [Desarmillaria tabescens]
MTSRLKKEATNGSLSALTTLCENATKDSTTFPVIINAIRQHLLATPVPRLTLNSSLTKRDDSSLHTIRSCFLCLKTALSDDALKSACNIALVSRLWPDMCRWITSFLDTHVVDVSTSSLETLLQNQNFFDMIDAILSLLLSLSNASPVLTCILETEDFIRSFTHSTVCLMVVTQYSLQPITTALLVRFWKPTSGKTLPAMAVVLHEMPPQRIIASLQGVVHKYRNCPSRHHHYATLPIPSISSGLSPQSQRDSVCGISLNARFRGSVISYLVSSRKYANYLPRRSIKISKRYSLPLSYTLSR